MSDATEFTDVELHAYIDGALDAERRTKIAARIENDPGLAARVAAFRSDKDMLKQVYGPLGHKPVPEKWITLARNAPPPRTISVRLVGSIAAALVAGILGTVTIQSLQHRQANEIVEAALDARQATTGAQKVIDVSPGIDTRAFNRAVSDTVKVALKVPDMGAMGYRLIGIRLYESAGAAELLYRDREGSLFTLYIRKSNGTTRFDQFPRGGLRVCVWQDEELGTVMAGNVSTAAMQRLAILAYSGLTL